MTYTKLKSYAVPAVAEILPLDNDSCQEMISYTLTLPNNEIQSHFLNLLGESEATFNFIATFMELKSQEDEQASKKSEKSEKSAAKRINKKENPQSIIPSKSKVKTPAWQTPEESKPPKQLKGRLDHNKSATTSELIDLKPSNQLTTQQAKKSKKKNLDSLKDIEWALNELEVSAQEYDLDSSNYIKRSCNCMATRHPLFEVAPNCLNCGKIICSKEGLQPCSFCGKDLLSFKDKEEIIKILKAEKENLDVKQDNIRNKSIQEQEGPSKEKAKKIKISVNPGENFWQAQDRALKKADEEKKKLQELIEKREKEQKEIEEQEIELKQYESTKNVDPELLKAQERLETLLNFQATGAERTKIIDRASDYEMPSSNNQISWLSPAERALRLKKQQKQLRKYEDEVKSRSGRGKKVVEMVIKDGKVNMVERTINTADDPENDKEMETLENEIKESKLQSEANLSRNVWDYKNDNKWEKPVYVPSSSRKETSNELPSKMNARVQLYGTDDENELVSALPC